MPAQRSTLAELEKSGTHRLVVVDDDADPPASNDCCQDWMWRSGDEREMRLRLHQLSLRALEHGHRIPEVDPWGMLRVGLRSVHLPAKQHALAAVLVRGFGRPVERDDLIRVAWPNGIDRPNMLAPVPGHRGDRGHHPSRCRRSRPIVGELAMARLLPRDRALDGACGSRRRRAGVKLAYREAGLVPPSTVV